MLRKIRITLAALVFVLITLLFLDVTGALHVWLGWLAKIQFFPALLALNVGILALLIIGTLIFGRIYCSVICPLGILQDIISNVHTRRKKNRFRYSPAKSILRYSVLVVFIAAFIAGIGSLVALLSPYSSYGRIAENLFRPVWGAGNNVLASIAEHFDSYSFYATDVWIKSMPTFVIAAVSLVVIGFLAWRGGRTYCNTICPVGTILSFLARFSWLKIHIDSDKCNKCGLCSRNCKAACIDFKNHNIDYSRCVVCGNCIGKCHKSAISYVHPSKKTSIKETPSNTEKTENKPVDGNRRSFLLGAALATTAAAIAQEKKKVDGGLAVIEDKVAPERATPLTPPGSYSAQNMAKHCTACQLCVSACPNGVLRPSTDLMKFMQPMMSYERGYCRPECTRCSDVCPTGAIKPITRADKSSTQIGHAVWVSKNCVPLVDGVECGNCARHCPTGAITMINMDSKDENSPKIPAVNVSRCIGCGACENLCPARPFSAIYVEGHEMHRIV
ncbi:MAG: 4Fe-4S binding protein [Prevotellaceae bacterium]|nr:4Fe-4S binding protein [Prevotellaceae bacterium]